MTRQGLTAEYLAELDRSSVFDAEYYLAGCGPFPYQRDDRWLHFFGGVAAEIIRSLHPQSVFDMGCAMGMLVESLWDLGTPSRGVDISAYAIGLVRPDMRRYCSVGSVTDPIEGSYDLITCIEVLEHVLPEEAQRAIAVMAAATNTILFSSTPTDFVEATHVNVQPVSAWIDQFGAAGFVPDLVFDASFLAPHAILFRRCDRKLTPDVAALYSRFILLRTAMVEREQRIGRLNAELSDARSARDRASEQLQGLAAKCDDLAHHLAELEEVNQTLRGHLAAAGEDISKLSRAEGGLLARIQELDRQVSAERERADAERNAKEDLLARIQELDRQVSAEKERANGERDAKENLRVHVEELDRQVSAERERTNGERNAKEDLRAHLEELDGQVSAERERANGERDAKEDLRAHIQELDRQVSSERARVIAGRDANEELHARILGLNRQAAAAGAAGAQVIAERDGLAQRLDEAGSHIDQLEEQITEANLNAARIGEELQDVYSSPGWQLISIYRKWLNRLRGKGGFGARGLEPLLNWSLRAVGLRANTAAAAPQSASGLATIPGAQFATGASDPAPAPAPAPAATLPSAELAPGASAPAPAPAPPPAATSPSAELAPGAAQAAMDYDAWIARTEPDSQELELQRTIACQFRLQPLISIVVPVFKLPIGVLRAMLDSVRQQTYQGWEICIVHADPEDTAARQYLRDAASQDARIRVECASQNLGISGNSNVALRMARGEYLALLDHDDALAPFALYEVAKVINERPEADFIYSDKDTISEDGGVRLNPLFKPRWSPDIMLSVNYLTHLCVMRTELVRAVGGWRAETDGAQDWDIFLRVIRRSRRVEFIPKVLYHWRIISTSVASTGFQAKPYAAEGQLNAVGYHLKDLGIQGKPVFTPQGALKVEWGGLQDLGASIIVVSDAPAGEVQQRARELALRTDHPAFEVIAIAPGLQAEADGIIRWIGCPSDMPLPARLNEAARHSKYPCLVFLDDSVDIGKGAWVGEIVGPLQQEAVALVGAKLLDPATLRIRHAGIVFNPEGKPDYILSGEPEHVNGAFGGGYWYRNWSAISGACFAVRRTAWERLRGFSETPDYPRLDIDLCLRAQLEGGYRIFYNPFACFQQVQDGLLERWLSPGGADRGAASIGACFPAGDPYFHPQLESRGGRVQFSHPERAVPASGDYAADARALTAGFDFSNSDVERSTAVCATPGRHEVKSITWFLPEFNHGFYGGIHTILRFAEYFQRAQAVSSQFVFLGGPPESVMRSRIADVFPELGQECGVSRLVSYGQLDSFPATDVAISTLWTTAFAALRFSKTRRKFYFIQDYESLFYPAGSISALAEATYRFGFHGICNTRGLLDTYLQMGGEAECFDPCIDPSIFYPPTAPRSGGPALVFCYARPGNPRNCFELLAAALSKVKRELGENVRFVAAGADWDPSVYGLDGVVQNLGLIGYSATGALYRACDAGVVMMMTRHPSYLPMELMACGALVVTNYNPHTSWLLRDRENCLLAGTSASAVADTIVRGLADYPLRSRIAKAALETVRQYSEWDGQAEKIYNYMLAVS